MRASVNRGTVRFVGRKALFVIACFSTLAACDSSSTWSVRRRVGPEGGIFEFRDVTLTLPAGALAEELDLELFATAPTVDAPARSAQYRFSPTLDLLQSAALALPFSGLGAATVATRASATEPFVAGRTTLIAALATLDATRLSEAIVVDAAWFPEAPTMARAAGTYENDFVVTAAEHDPAQTYCYTIDGAFPACATDGTCAPGAEALGALGVPITDAAPEKVLRAIACLPARASDTKSFSYALKVGSVDPTPYPGTYPGPLNVTFLSGTAGATIRYSTLNARITCETGMVVPDGGITLTETTRIQFIGCKTGYLPSVVNQPTDPYTITL